MLSEVLALVVATVFAICGLSFWLGVNSRSADFQAMTLKVIARTFVLGGVVLLIAIVYEHLC